MRLNHIALTVTDRKISADFYATFFGLTQHVHDDDHLLILSNDAGDLLALSTGAIGFELPRTNHFGFMVANKEEVLEMRDKFKAAGVIETEFQASMPTRVQVLDPDGYRVEVYAF